MKVKDESKRLSYIDKVSGLLIVNMIIVHCFIFSDLIHVNNSYCMLPLSFFMFWFFYKSGMFYNRSKTYKEIISGGVKNLFIHMLFLVP